MVAKKNTHYLLPKYSLVQYRIITIWQAARGAEAHQCWPPIVTNWTDIMNVEKTIENKQTIHQTKTRLTDRQTFRRNTPARIITVSPHSSIIAKAINILKNHAHRHAHEHTRYTLQTQETICQLSMLPNNV